MRASLFLLAVIGVLFCPFFRPLLVQHLAVQQSFHMQFHFWDVNPDHPDTYEAPQVHAYADGGIGMVPGRATQSHKAPDGTVSLTSHNAEAQSLFNFSVSSYGVSAAFITLDSTPHFVSLYGNEALLEDTFLAPLKIPPRV